ncbi:bifunctional hydroxymethylpyrimidine kinase/phosphomethylpyrimidine kinase [Thalassobacillus sp. CUG 92003]|uniref:bifunctional hydroxymethylpyrimidine kinase/phosphomethylpyrimidine kinase n=1 Tax=Thalassobacillus sp. CUG 92003 TaxID=2736641 RepID=UPI0015E630CD|nr:bifunctional hydroxymethylpyrimidine kinase/phosphomethylpyrimidine kinase [Thalassobacillus sp. CUG 92003]
MFIPRVLSIAGSAAQASAGIQADLKTFQEQDVYGMSAITAIVANNSKTAQGMFTHSVEAIEAQIYAAWEHVGIDALKTGMLFTEEIIVQVASQIEAAEVEHVVVDPVMIGKMGSKLLQDDAIETMKQKLIPLATLVTPNLQEAAHLLNEPEASSPDEMREAARKLYGLGPSYILLKGGGLKGHPAIDILYDGSEFIELESRRIPTIHTSGAGCTYSAAIAAQLAKGNSVTESVREAKAFVTSAIEHALSFERGIGSTYHAAYRKFKK